MKIMSSPLFGNSESNLTTEESAVRSARIQERRLRQVVEMIDEKPSSSIRDLAFEVSLSPAHLQRLFKRQTGIQLGSLVAEKRLLKAAHLLMESNLSIKEIAHAVGYRHHSSFVRAFQRRFSQAPKRYRYHDDAGQGGEIPGVTKC
jgi:transcriptional regulator GlxA family with amidase domain